MNASVRLLVVVLLGLFAVGTVGAAWADEKNKEATAVAAPEQAQASPSAKNDTKVRNSPDSFERTARLESMRYRHLWLAYGFIWLIVFLFMFRTWKLHQSNSVELDALTRRLKALESDERPVAATTETKTPAGGNDGDA